MSVINIRPVKRGESKAVIGISGGTGSGKTVTAILMARGMVNHPSEIGFLDTENKRGSLYADLLDAPFMIGDLYAPFSPGRYADAIKQFQAAGCKVLVIDSVSHEWEGEGGVDDIANAPLKAGKKMADWISAKREHKAFMNVLLQCDMDVIVCIRAREKTSFANPKEPVSLGMQPICEKNFMFEMTASIMMYNEGMDQVWLKMPNYFRDIFCTDGESKKTGTNHGYLGVQTGKAVRQWLSEGEKEPPEITRIKSEMLMACENGFDALVKVWESVPKELKKMLMTHKEICKASAEEYDRQKSIAETDNGTPPQNDQEQARIKNFIDACTDVRQLDQFAGKKLSAENQKLLTEKILTLENAANDNYSSI